MFTKMKTYKQVLMIVVCLGAAMAFSSCNKDEDLDGGEKAPRLHENQMYIDGKTIDVTCSVRIRQYPHSAAGLSDLYQVEIKGLDNTDEWSGYCTLEKPNVGKTIDLSDPEPTTGNNYFDLGFIKVYINNSKNVRDRLWVFDLYGRFSSFEEEGPTESSCFKSGTFTSSHGRKGLRLSYSGVFINGKAVALKIFIPEKEIEYYEVDRLFWHD